MAFFTSTSTTPLAEGLSAVQWVELLATDRAAWASKALAYYDGQQLEELIKVMNLTRKDWRARGFIPRVRNLTAAIISKSGQLFKDGPPVVEIYPAKGAALADASSTQRLSDLLHAYNWTEVFTGLDAVTRLLRTAVLLAQWDPTEQRLYFDVLHRGNCEVVINPTTRAISSLIYRTSTSPNGNSYRVITPFEVIDLEERKGNISVGATVPNPLGRVPAAVFYDTVPPRAGFWVEAPHDLVGLNELVNLHLTDSEFASSWAKRPTLFTNMTFAGAGTDLVPEISTGPLPRLVETTPAITGGPGQAVTLNSVGVDSPFVKYEGPDPKLGEQNEVVEAWIKAFAHDWSVRLDVAGTGRASSGFQLTVEELPNLELRQRRAQEFAAGFRRFYSALVALSPLTGVVLPATAHVEVTFAPPALPLNELEQEQVWSKRIAEGRASVIDYLMTVQHLTKEEALLKRAEIASYTAPVPPPVSTPSAKPGETI